MRGNKVETDHSRDCRCGSLAVCLLKCRTENKFLKQGVGAFPVFQVALRSGGLCLRIYVVYR